MKLAITILCAAATAAHADAPADTATTPAPPVATRWLSVGAMTELTHYQPARGLRADADLASIDGWLFGGGAALVGGKLGIYDGSRTVLLSTTDVKAVGYVARALHWRRFELRGTLGAGVMRTTASGEMMNLGTTQHVAQSGLFPTVEASVRATVPISTHVAITGGPILSYLHQTFAFDNPGPTGPTTREGELMLMVGVAYRP